LKFLRHLSTDIFKTLPHDVLLPAVEALLCRFGHSVHK